MAKVNVDTSELRTLSADMHAIPDRLQRHVAPVVARGANNIAREVRENFEASTHFSPVARTVRYEISTRSAFGTGSVEAEIGPMSSDRGGGDAAALAHIAIHGSPRGGGGNVKDPIVALENEAPRFQGALEDLVEDLL